MIEEFVKVIFEILFYQIGKLVASFAFPKIVISKSMKEPKQSFKDFFKFTFKKQNINYFYNDSVTLIGLIFSIAVIFMLVFLKQ